MGDFYELFFEDAEIASQTLGIVLKSAASIRAWIYPCAACRWSAPRTICTPDRKRAIGCGV